MLRVNTMRQNAARHGAILSQAIVSAELAPQRRKLRVMVIDPHKLLRSAVSALIRGAADMECCGEGSTAIDAVGAITCVRPDIVLLDAQAWHRAPVEFWQVVSQNPIRLVVMTAYHGAQADRLLAAGATAVVAKSDMAVSLLDALRRAAVKPIVRPPEGLLGREANAESERHTDYPRLDRVEREIVELIGRGITTRAIAVRLGLSAEAVETSRKRIREILNLVTGTQLVEFCVRWVNVKTSREGLTVLASDAG
jgi:DNA-binding NarL/FixJ family response regulator